MPRKSLKKAKGDIAEAAAAVQRLVVEVASAACDELAAERRVDADHINQHIKASEDALERLAALESMIRDLIMFEKERLKALQGHHEDMTTEEPILGEPQQFKQILGGKS
jgi:hypothetical protein